MPFEPIRRILPQAIQSAGISRQVTSARVIEEAGQALVRLWGEEKAAYIQIISFQEGILKCKALAPVAMQELKVWEVRFQNEINRVLGSRAIMSIRVVL